ncbi:enolase C-terminal domain-like protein [Streptomyces sp. NPDC004629]|uniref:enolase C-terminal domain-like protein n=1 Tax=Streptomyces sp. NPDC004629 TaxID=3364705 RepID=UPI0036C31940
MVEEGGFDAVKLKGTRDVRGDVAILRALRAALPEVNLRVDPNAAWSVPDSVRAGITLEELDLEYLEDPCSGIEGMSQVKAKIRIPLCTNMCVVRFEEFAPAMRLNAVDVIHGDVYKWGGIAATKALAAHCETFGLGMNLHSGGELGIATAAHLAVVASTPVLSRAIDSMYYLHADDIIEPLHLENGRLRIPEGPGLGVTVDEDKLRHFAAVNSRRRSCALCGRYSRRSGGEPSGNRSPALGWGDRKGTASRNQITYNGNICWTALQVISRMSPAVARSTRHRDGLPREWRLKCRVKRPT